MNGPALNTEQNELFMFKGTMPVCREFAFIYNVRDSFFFARTRVIYPGIKVNVTGDIYQTDFYYHRRRLMAARFCVKLWKCLRDTHKSAFCGDYDM